MLARWYSTYGKSLWAAAAMVVTVVHTSLSDGHVSTVEWLQIIISVFTAALVYLLPEHPQWTGVKTVVGVALAGLNAVVTLVVSGNWSGRWTELALAALTALLVGAAPAQSVGAKPAPAGGNGA